MRKLILISALLAASTAFAQAGESRGLSLAGAAVTEPAKPIAEVSMQLAQAATTPTETTAPAQTQAPAATTATTTEPKATETKATETKTTETKPAKPAKKVTRESDEHKARRIAAKYGVYW
jgi:outer membrane biosynthesis protein TonB